jgi:hypothetical protein
MDTKSCDIHTGLKEISNSVTLNLLGNNKASIRNSKLKKDVTKTPRGPELKSAYEISINHIITYP